MLELDWELVVRSLPLLWKGMKITLLITGTAIVFGMVLGTVLALMRFSPLPPLRWVSKLYVNGFRSIPLVMVLMWFYLVVPQLVARILDLSPKTDIRLISAITAFTLFEAAYYSEIIRAGINGISPGQTGAGLALGMTRLQVLTWVLLPQAFRTMTPLLLTQAVVLFQDSALVYMLGLGDFFRTATNIGKTNGCEPGMVLFAGAVYFVICFIASRIVDYCKGRVSVPTPAK